MTPIPGTFRTKHSKRVGGYIPFDAATGDVFLYTLDELAHAFGTNRINLYREPELLDVDDGEGGRLLPKSTWLEKRTPKPGPRDPVKRKAGKLGWTGRWASALKKLRLLEECRGGFAQDGDGTRGHAVMLLAFFLKRLKYPGEYIADEAFAMGQRCRPPLSGQELKHAVRRGLRMQGGMISDAYLARTFKVTAAEADLLGGWYPEGVEASPANDDETRAEKRRRRRHAVEEYVRQVEAEGRDKASISVTELEAYLDGLGIEASRRTVHLDMLAAGIGTRRVPGKSVPSLFSTKPGEG
jgi:hypothetical protein